jgi:uncharacterized protein
MLAANVSAWFEIPSHDFQRAVSFYEKLFDVRLKSEGMGPVKMAVFPYSTGGNSGAVVHGQAWGPSEEGTVLYLNSELDISVPLKKVTEAGGETLVPRTQLPNDIGFFAQIRDSEGNRVGLFSRCGAPTVSSN